MNPVPDSHTVERVLTASRLLEMVLPAKWLKQLGWKTTRLLLVGK